VKIALAQLNFIIGNFDYNCRKIIDCIHKASDQHADLVVFSELAVCGYPPHDLLEQPAFVKKCIESVERIAAECTKIAAIVGAPSLNENVRGKNLFNSAYFLNNGKIESIHNKALLPTYDIFDEYRYFEPAIDFSPIQFKGKKIALNICEDLWDILPEGNPFGRNSIYNVCPMDDLSMYHPDLIINISGSPFSYSNAKTRLDILTTQATRHKLPLFYVNQTGAHTDLIFDGGSVVVNKNGEIVDSLALFDEDFKVYDLDNLPKSKVIKNLSVYASDIEKIEKALILGIRDYFQKSNLSKAVLGLSGGIDSAVTLVLAVKALGSENVSVLLLPSQYSSDHSVNDAVKLAQNLNIQYDTIPIEKAFNTFVSLLEPVFKNTKSDITEENIQARVRGVLLMAVSNKFGHILLNTSNKSEIAVGYGTLYGDMNGGLSVLGDVYKTRVYELAHFMNRDSEVIPANIITKPPSAELRPDQKDSDSLPEYDQLDAVLYQYIEMQKSADDIIHLGFDKALVERVLRLVNFNEYKRFQTPPILRISSKAFGSGRKMPIVARY
jgi:NAD+ synthase (glutamine-hydrolysing)